LLAYSEDEVTRRASLRGLSSEVADQELEQKRLAAWHDLLRHHPDASVMELAQGIVTTKTALKSSSSECSGPVIRSTVVEALAGTGIGRIAVLANDQRRGQWNAAIFTCDVDRGVVLVEGETASSTSSVEPLLNHLRSTSTQDTLEDANGLAVSLLGACWSIGRPHDPAARFWLEATVGSAVHAKSIAEALEPQIKITPVTMQSAAFVLDHCTDWFDRSGRVYELAEEILLRHGDVEPDYARDAGALRFLFEHRLVDRLEIYRRMLVWMSWLWHEGGADELAGAAAGLARELGDPQHAVPSHAWFREISRRSLRAAMSDILYAGDPRPTSSDEQS
jgi:hypothetical protein